MLKTVWKRGAGILMLQLIVGMVTYTITDDIVPTGALATLAAFFAFAPSAAFAALAILSAMTAQPAVLAVSVICVILITLDDTEEARKTGGATENFFVLFLTALPAGIGFTIGGIIFLFRHMQQQSTAV